MTHRLILARHAKSSWADLELRDHDRPLNKRGRNTAPLVAAALRDMGAAPQIVYCSTAARTRETWALMEPAFRDRPRTELMRELYLASPGTVLDVIRQVPKDVGSVMLMGHNPGTHALAAGLAKSGNPDEIALLRAKFPTGAVAVIDLRGPWGRAGEGGNLVSFVLPRWL